MREGGFITRNCLVEIADENENENENENAAPRMRIDVRSSHRKNREFFFFGARQKMVQYRTSFGALIKALIKAHVVARARCMNPII